MTARSYDESALLDTQGSQSRYFIADTPNINQLVSVEVKSHNLTVVASYDHCLLHLIQNTHTFLLALDSGNHIKLLSLDSVSS